MDFLNNFSLGLANRYSIKIKQKVWNKGKKEFGARNKSQHNKDKGGHNS
jgi:hypothetical protein